MVDAFSRLFGKSNKKGSSSSSPGATPSSTSLFEGSQPPAPGSNSNNQEDEGFTLLSHPNRVSLSNNGFNGYPALPNNDSSAPPYPPVYPGAGGGGGGYPSGTMTSQSSTTVPHVLDGIPFQLSERCSLKSRRHGNDKDSFLNDVQAKLQVVQNLIESANYDFRLEKSVIDSDISSTMKRMQTY